MKYSNRVIKTVIFQAIPVSGTPSRGEQPQSEKRTVILKPTSMPRRINAEQNFMYQGDSKVTQSTSVCLF